MSGGSHDYAYSKLNDIADSFSPIREEPAQIELRTKVGEILRLMSDVCFIIEWIDSSDYGPEDWKDVKKKLDTITIKKP